MVESTDSQKVFGLFLGGGLTWSFQPAVASVNGS